jgi:ferredoxin
MRQRGLKVLRVTGAAVVFAGLTAALVDFRGAVPPAVGQGLASVQFIPSAVALATGAGVALACFVILVVTLAAGRVYCSVICPLGVFQDIVARMAGWVRRKKPLLPYRPAQTWIRQLFLWGSVAGIAAGGAGLTLCLLDPYSIFGRIASGLFRPAVTLGNNALVSLIRALGGESLYRVVPPWAGVAALAVPVAMLALIAGLAAWRSRLYCNTVCPVGTLLGFVSARSAWQLSINPEVCRKCGDCLRDCKAQCIDLRAGTIDSSRCVACYNCLGACPEAGIGYRWTWQSRSAKPAGPPAPAANRAANAADPQRRAFIATAVLSVATITGAGRLLASPAAASDPPAPPGAKEEKAPTGSRRPNYSRAICPPGAGSVDRFLATCTACHLCVSACPTHVLQPAFLEYGLLGLLRPRLAYADAFCNFECRRCAEVCPDGALGLLPLAQKQVTRIGVAELDVEKCIVKTKGTDCAACSEHCPTKAVDTVPYGDNLRLPQVNEELCIGCGACEFACPSKPDKAITVAGQHRHDQAKRRREEKARDPRRGSAFPF